VLPLLGLAVELTAFIFGLIILGMVASIVLHKVLKPRLMVQRKLLNVLRRTLMVSERLQKVPRRSARL
jgi:hypothetical protein